MNEYTISVWDAPWVWRVRRVDRRNRGGDYIVDVEDRTCTCIRHEMYGEHCRHLELVREALMGIALGALPEKLRRQVAGQLAKERRLAGLLANGRAKIEERRAMAKIRASDLAETEGERLNATELEFLRHLRGLGWPQVIGIMSITLKIASDCRYTPDFWVIDQDGNLVFYEVKGFMREDALVKLKVAARRFSWARFRLVRRVRASKGERLMGLKHRWDIKEVKP